MITGTYIADTIDRAFEGLDIMLGIHKRARLSDSSPVDFHEEPTVFIAKNREGTDRIFTKVDGGYTIEGETYTLRIGYEEDEICFADFDGGQFVRVGFQMEELCKGCSGTITRIEELETQEKNWAKIMCWTI